MSEQNSGEKKPSLLVLVVIGVIVIFILSFTRPAAEHAYQALWSIFS